MKTFLLVAATVLLAPASLTAAVLAQYDFSSDYTNSAPAVGAILTTFNSGDALTDVTLDAGAWYGETWSTSSDPDVVRQSNSYVWFSITPDSGMTLTLTEISFDVRPHGSGPKNLFIDVIRMDNSNPVRLGSLGASFSHSDQTITGSGDESSMPGTGTLKTWETVSRSSGDYQNLVGTFEIRIYGYNAAQPDRQVLIDHLVLQGSVTAIPEPSTYALLALAVLGFAARRRVLWSS